MRESSSSLFTGTIFIPQMVNSVGSFSLLENILSLAASFLNIVAGQSESSDGVDAAVHLITEMILHCVGLGKITPRGSTIVRSLCGTNRDAMIKAMTRVVLESPDSVYNLYWALRKLSANASCWNILDALTVPLVISGEKAIAVEFLQQGYIMALVGLVRPQAIENHPEVLRHCAIIVDNIISAIDNAAQAKQAVQTGVLRFVSILSSNNLDDIQMLLEGLSGQ